MGYTTTFTGKFKIVSSLTKKEYNTLIEFIDKRYGGDVKPYKDMPGFYCQWTPDDEGEYLQWDGGEKFYNYVEWLEYLIENYFKPWNKKLNGSVEWHGEENSDIGIIKIKNNVINAKKAKLVFDE